MKVATLANFIFHLQDAVKRALPHATQVADRYHLVQNLREHVQRFFDRKRTCLPEIEDTPLNAVSPGEGASASDQAGEGKASISEERSPAKSADQRAPEREQALGGPEIELAC